MIHTPNCPGGTCDDPETTFLCDVCGDEFAACCGVAESETCDDCEGKMELARLTDVCGDAHTIVRTCDGSPVISIGGHAHSLYAADALWLLDSAGLNTTANELRERLECDRAIASSRLDAINRLHSEANDLRAKLEESSRQLSEVSAMVNVTMGEREALKLKLAEREDDLVRAGKLWDETQRKLEEALAQTETDAAAISDRDVELEQLKSDLEALRKMNLNLLDEAKGYQGTIAQLRQADTVRPAADISVTCCQG